MAQNADIKPELIAALRSIILRKVMEQKVCFLKNIAMCSEIKFNTCAFQPIDLDLLEHSVSELTALLKKVDWKDCTTAQDRIRRAVRKGMTAALESENWAVADKFWTSHW